MSLDADKTRILVVDDSAVFRGYWTKVLSAVEGFEVLTTAINGAKAIEAVKAFPVDIVILDIEMPEMDGLTALPQLLKLKPNLRVIMASSLTHAGSKATIEALALGASDYVAKPSSLAPGAGAQEVAVQLVQKIQALRPAMKRKGVPAVTSLQAVLAKATQPDLSIIPKILVVGSSTGGPNALSVLMRELPKELNIPILIVQHMPAYFTSMLAERIGRESGRAAVELKEGDRIATGMVGIAPGDYHITVEKSEGGEVVRLNQGPPEHFCRPAVDPLFRSVAAVYGKFALSVVLTGMGEDGGAGSLAIQKAGGKVIAQDEETSVVWGMPGAVVKAGAAHWVLPLQEIGSQVAKLCQVGKFL